MAAAVLLGLAGLGGCVRHAPAPAPALVASPHYTLGAAYRAGGHWFYPAEDEGLDTTGLASVSAAAGGGLTANGELWQPGALVAAMQTIPLPAVAEVTNLENGRQILVRVNDRGPASPARIIAVSPRAALLLAMPPAGVARVRVRLDGAMTREVVEQVGGGPRLAIATAAPGVVTTEDLPAPGATRAPAARPVVAARVEAGAPKIPDRLPERIRLVGMHAGSLWLRAGVFGRLTYANQQVAALAGLEGEVLSSREGRQARYAVRAGPFASVAAADAALGVALAAGVADARISVEE